MASPLQIYPGYRDEDVSMLRTFVVREAKVESDHFVDGFSQRTFYSCVPFCTEFNTERLTLPVPDDGFHAEALEYIALADAVQRATNGFCAVEIGAGWGPWLALAGVLARNRRISDIDLVGIEALPARFMLMKAHLAANGLRPDTDANESHTGGIRCVLVQGAASPNRTTLWFPDVATADMGPAASESDVSHDYRGKPVQNIRVEGYTLAELIGSRVVDYLHIDVQGSEVGLIESNLDLLDRQVHAMMIATHSRAIEGRLVDLLYERGWYLHREKPCRVAWSSKPASLVAMTEVDGCQYWRKTSQSDDSTLSAATLLPRMQVGDKVAPSDVWPSSKSGWSKAEAGPIGACCWNDGKAATLEFECSNAAKARAVVLGVWTLGEQRVSVRANNAKEVTLLLGGWSDHEIVIPLSASDLHSDGVNRLVFDFPDAKRPGNGDERLLALAMKWIELR